MTVLVITEKPSVAMDTAVPAGKKAATLSSGRRLAEKRSAPFRLKK